MSKSVPDEGLSVRKITRARTWKRPPWKTLYRRYIWVQGRTRAITSKRQRVRRMGRSSRGIVLSKNWLELQEILGHDTKEVNVYYAKNYVLILPGDIDLTPAGIYNVHRAIENFEALVDVYRKMMEGGK